VELVAPIVDPGVGLVGYDVVSVSLDPLRTAIGSTASRFDSLSVTVSAAGQPVFTLPGHDTSGEATVSMTSPVAPDWVVTVSQTEDALYRTTRRFVLLLSLAVGTITAALLAVIHWALSILLPRGRLRAARLSSLVEERTEELNRALEARGVLLREVHHRIKNDLAMVGSLLTLRRQEAQQEESQSALAEAEAHVRTVGSIYDALYRADDYGRIRIKTAFEQLFADVVASHQGQPDSVDLDVRVEDLELDRQVAAPVGIITNELIINALKYGRPETGRPRISVTIAGGTPRGVQILVTDNGPAIDPARVEAGPGFGMVMVRAMAEQFSGGVRVPQEFETGAVEVLLRDTEE
jgi:two-component sensor histidine kinase